MKQSCRGNNFKGSGAKGNENKVQSGINLACEFHEND